MHLAPRVQDPCAQQAIGGFSSCNMGVGRCGTRARIHAHGPPNGPRYACKEGQPANARRRRKLGDVEVELCRARAQAHSRSCETTKAFAQTYDNGIGQAAVAHDEVGRGAHNHVRDRGGFFG